MVDSYNLPWVVEVNCQQIFRRKFKVNGRVRGIAQRVYLFDVPVPAVINTPCKHAACFNVPTLINIVEQCLVGIGANRGLCARVFSHVSIVVAPRTTGLYSKTDIGVSTLYHIRKGPDTRKGCHYIYACGRQTCAVPYTLAEAIYSARLHTVFVLQGRLNLIFIQPQHLAHQ